MPLTIGQSFGSFHVLSQLGAGGMGEVYKARDTQLDRDVALKVLPDTFAADPERLARFEREAKTLASLNHPNIAHLHGIERTGGTRALVMELVQGEDLAARIARGPLALPDAIPIARQIADALEFAHDLGIVHRDLKPANVMVRADGAVKVLDFGLAKALATDSAGADPTNSPTLTAQTQFGMILGTAAYMSPEQARGKVVDKRADIWAFGVVLFEMLTGERLFKGDETSDVLAAVLRQDIDWTRLPFGTPLRLRRVLNRCLDRDPKTRLRDIGEARVELARLERGTPDDLASAIGLPAQLARRSLRVVLGWGVAAIAIAIATVLAIWLSASAARTDASRSVRLTFLAPDNVVAEAGGALISPDGQKLLFTGRGADGRRVLWLRLLDSLEANPLPDTDDAIEPFWSPDSKAIAFAAQGKLKRLDLGEARARPLTDAARSNGGTWNTSGTIVFCPDYRSVLYRVSDSGGPRTPVTVPDPGIGSLDHRYPYFLPDGRHFLYSSARKVMVGLLDSTETKVLMPDFAPALYAQPGWLIYVRNGTLVAHAFDADRLELTGEPIPISAEPLGGGWPQGARASASDTGVLVIQHAAQYSYQLGWYDRSGKSISVFGPMRMVSVPELPRLAADDSRVLVQRSDPATQNQDLWIGNLARATFDRFTTDPTLEQMAFWSLDGRSVIANARRNSVQGIYRIPAGSGETQLITTGTVFPADVSPDGKWLFFLQRGETTRQDIWVQAAADDASAATARPPRNIIHSEADESQLVVSPDSRWLAYASDINGIYDVYVRRLEADGSVSGETRVSDGGGVQPSWSHDGRALFYVNASKGYLSAEMIEVPVTPSTSKLEFGPAKPLFKMPMLPIQMGVRDHDLTHDDKRFVIGRVMGDARATPATIVLNWMAGIGK